MTVVNIPVEALSRISAAEKQAVKESGGFFPEAGLVESGPASGQEAAQAQEKPVDSKAPASAEEQAAFGGVECEIHISDKDVPLSQRCESDVVINISADEKTVEVGAGGETSNLSDENKAALDELRERLKKADQHQEAELNKMVGSAKEAVTSAASA